MAGARIRISEKSKRVLQELASQGNESMQAILDKAIEMYHRERLLREANAAFAELRKDEEAWAAELREREEWHGALSAGGET